jgi:CPA2 family monovalent cation:H+ antiporter-2
MFGVGLHFDVSDLMAVRKIAVPGALIQSVVATLLGAIVAHLFGWDWRAGFVFGIAISVASTVVLTRVLADNHQLATPAGHVAVGWLIVEDLLTVLVLVVLPLVVGPKGEGLLWPLVRAVLEIAALFALVGVVGKRFVPWVLAQVARTGSRELFTLAVLVIALGIAVAAAIVFHASMALGAFLAGMVVRQSELSERAAIEALPLRDAFAVLFFVSVGMLFDPTHALDYLPLTLATLAVVMIGKPLAALVVVLVLRKPLSTALTVSIALAQVGEFSFMVAALGRDLGVLPQEAMQVLVAVSILSIPLDTVVFRIARSSMLSREGSRATASP